MEAVLCHGAVSGFFGNSDSWPLGWLMLGLIRCRIFILLLICFEFDIYLKINPSTDSEVTGSPVISVLIWSVGRVIPLVTSKTKSWSSLDEHAAKLRRDL